MPSLYELTALLFLALGASGAGRRAGPSELRVLLIERGDYPHHEQEDEKQEDGPIQFAVAGVRKAIA